MKTIAHLVYYFATIAVWWSLPWIASDDSKLLSHVRRDYYIAHGVWVVWGLLVTYISVARATDTLFRALRRRRPQFQPQKETTE